MNHPLFIYIILLQSVKCFMENEPPSSHLMRKGGDYTSRETNYVPKTEVILSLETVLLNTGLVVYDQLLPQSPCKLGDLYWWNLRNSTFRSPLFGSVTDHIALYSSPLINPFLSALK